MHTKRNLGKVVTLSVGKSKLVYQTWPQMVPTGWAKSSVLTKRDRFGLWSFSGPTMQQIQHTVNF